MTDFKRKCQGKTDYKKRLKLLVSGKPRLVIRKSNKNITAQIVEFSPAGDKIIVSAHTNEIKKLGWKGAKRNIPAAYLLGLMIGKKAKRQKISEVILDIGLQKSVKGSVLYSSLKGVADSSLKVPCSDKIFPTEERITGTHIAKNEKTKFTKFNKADVPVNFEEVKNKILKLENGKQSS